MLRPKKLLEIEETEKAKYLPTKEEYKKIKEVRKEESKRAWIAESKLRKRAQKAAKILIKRKRAKGPNPLSVKRKKVKKVKKEVV